MAVGLATERNGGQLVLRPRSARLFSFDGHGQHESTASIVQTYGAGAAVAQFYLFFDPSGGGINGEAMLDSEAGFCFLSTTEAPSRLIPEKVGVPNE